MNGCRGLNFRFLIGGAIAPLELPPAFGALPADKPPPHQAVSVPRYPFQPDLLTKSSSRISTPSMVFPTTAIVNSALLTSTTRRDRRWRGAA